MHETKEHVRRRCVNCGFIFDGRGSCPKCQSNATDPINKKPMWQSNNK